MITIRTTYPILLALAAGIALSACGKKEEPVPPPVAVTPPAATPAPVATPAPAPVSVTSVDLGNAVGADQKVTTPTTTFAPTDTVYAAVSTTGSAPSATLSAKWTFEDGQTVNESSQTIAPSGDAVTTFHIAKEDGFPTGSYKVDISLNGASVATKDFTIQ